MKILVEKTGFKPEEMDLLISTEKLSDVVLLRIDKIEAKKEQPESSGRAPAR